MEKDSLRTQLIFSRQFWIWKRPIIHQKRTFNVGKENEVRTFIELIPPLFVQTLENKMKKSEFKIYQNLSLTPLRDFRCVEKLFLQLGTYQVH